MATLTATGWNPDHIDYETYKEMQDKSIPADKFPIQVEEITEDIKTYPCVTYEGKQFYRSRFIYKED